MSELNTRYTSQIGHSVLHVDGHLVIGSSLSSGNLDPSNEDNELLQMLQLINSIQSLSIFDLFQKSISKVRYFGGGGEMLQFAKCFLFTDRVKI